MLCYVKNHNLGFTIPYTIDGEERGYIPDFIVRLRLREEQVDFDNAVEKTSIRKSPLPAELLQRCRGLRKEATDAEIYYGNCFATANCTAQSFAASILWLVLSWTSTVMKQK